MNKVLKGVEAEVGTILGPNYSGEWMIVRRGTMEFSDGTIGVGVGYAYPQEIQNAMTRMLDGEAPRSIAERNMGKKAGIL